MVQGGVQGVYRLGKPATMGMQNTGDAWAPGAQSEEALGS
jgi:hypothetical protein